MDKKITIENIDNVDRIKKELEEYKKSYYSDLGNIKYQEWSDIESLECQDLYNFVCELYEYFNEYCNTEYFLLNTRYFLLNDEEACEEFSYMTDAFYTYSKKLGLYVAAVNDFGSKWHDKFKGRVLCRSI